MPIVGMWLDASRPLGLMPTESMAERFSLLAIIVMGEVVVGVVNGINATDRGALVPVSYTHLDVYKRQHQASSPGPSTPSSRRWPTGAGAVPGRPLCAAPEVNGPTPPPPRSPGPQVARA